MASTSTVNKPNHQDVICENRPDQEAKGVKIKTEKQSDKNATWLNIMPGKLRPPLKSYFQNQNMTTTSAVNKPTHKDKNQNKEYNHNDFKCLKQNRTSTVNKPNHQDVIDNKQTNPDVICEKGPDQNAKGVYIETRKQPDQDVKWLNIMTGKIMSLLKPYFINQNMASTPTVNKPNHQDVISENRQTIPDVIREIRPDQKAKGVKIKTRKQQDKNATWLNIMPGKSMFHLKPLILLLLLTSLPVTSATPRDFKWLPTNKTVKGIYETDITLVWKYESNLMVDKIDISRGKTEYEKEKENVALWTPEKGSVANRLLSTDVTLQYWKEGDVGSIILTLITAYPEDFDKIYSCVISSEHGLHSMDKELEAYKLEYWPVNKVVEGRPGQDVKLVWNYKYPLPVKYVNFYLDHDIQDDILAWSSFGIYDVEDRYKNRVMLNMTSNNDQEVITLTLINTKRDDYNHTYNSRAISPKGYWTVKEIYLQLSPVEEDEKTEIKTGSRQQPSSTSGLSKVSIFLVCFVLLLAVQI